jgi:hypothetical protein
VTRTRDELRLPTTRTQTAIFEASAAAPATESARRAGNELGPAGSTERPGLNRDGPD